MHHGAKITTTAIIHTFLDNNRKKTANVIVNWSIQGYHGHCSQPEIWPLDELCHVEVQERYKLFEINLRTFFQDWVNSWRNHLSIACQIISD